MLTTSELLEILKHAPQGSGLCSDAYNALSDLVHEHNRKHGNKPAGLSAGSEARINAQLQALDKANPRANIIGGAVGVAMRETNQAAQETCTFTQKQLQDALSIEVMLPSGNISAQVATPLGRVGCIQGNPLAEENAQLKAENEKLKQNLDYHTNPPDLFCAVDSFVQKLVKLGHLKGEVKQR